MRRPIIVITTSRNERECVLNHAYAEAVKLGGGLPVMLPTVRPDSICEEYADMADGILFSGGTDILPAYFGEFLHEGYEMPYELSPERDRFEIALFKYAEQKKMPILGICRGIQLMAVAGGGSIYQDIDSMMARQVRIRHSQHAPANSLSHPVIVDDSSRLGGILKQKTVWVNSMHHQAVRVVPMGYRVSATSPDGVIEGMEAASAGRFAVGVQWHPERLLSDGERERCTRLFAEFVKAAEQYGREVKRNGDTAEGRVYY